MADPRLINLSTGITVVERLAFAANFWTRFRGLQFQKSLPPDLGLLIAPCRSIHTHWMRFAIDVAMLDRNGIVVQFHPNVEPWRILAGDRAVAYVLETIGGKVKIPVGDRLGIQMNGNSGGVPAILKHLLVHERSKEQA